MATTLQVRRGVAPPSAKQSHTVELARVEIDALLRERASENLWDAQPTIEMVRIPDELYLAEDDEPAAPHPSPPEHLDAPRRHSGKHAWSEDDEDDEDQSPTLELIAVIPARNPSEPRLAHGSDVMARPNLTRRYQRTELQVIDILRGVCGKR